MMISAGIISLNAMSSDPPADNPTVSPEHFVAPSQAPLPSLHHLPAVSQIIPHLYLCDAQAAVSRQVLTSLRITHVVSVMGPALRFPPSIQVLHIPIEDMPWEDLLSQLPKSTEWIQRALMKEDAHVLVHCWQGISRSASIVAAYFIKTQDMSANAAVAFVRSHRRIVRPNHGFMQQLKHYEAIVRADDESDYSMK